VTWRRIFSIAIDMRKTAIAMGLGMLLVAGCGKQPNAEESTRYARGHALPDLVFAANAPVFDTGGVPYVEAAWIDGIWKIHDDGVWQADCRKEDDIYRIMREAWEKRPESRILISAGGSTAFREIREMVRGAARAGFWRVDFLVKTAVSNRANHSFRHELPTADERSRQPDIEPIFIRVNSRGAVFSGTGPGQALLDSAYADHALPKLNGMLELLTAAAKAANTRPFLQVHADPAANYQRVIDVLARFHEHRITDIMFIDLDPSMDEKPIKHPEPETKPSSPWSEPPRRVR
jgi:biopolymer transport protein ExbD